MRNVPEMAAEYPDPSRYGVLPAYGPYARHVKNLTLDHIELQYAREDLRPAVFMQGVTGADFDHLKAANSARTSIIACREVSDLTVHDSPGLADRLHAGPLDQRALQVDAGIANRHR